MWKVAVVSMVLHIVIARPQSNGKVAMNTNDINISTSTPKELHSNNASQLNLKNAIDNYLQMVQGNNVYGNPIGLSSHSEDSNKDEGIVIFKQSNINLNNSEEESSEKSDNSTVGDRIGTPVIITLQGFAPISPD